MSRGKKKGSGLRVRLEDLGPEARAAVEAQLAADRARDAGPARTCICAGACKGSEWLAPGWVCALKQRTPAAPARPARRPVIHGMSGPERDYRDWLECEKRAGRVEAWAYEPLRLILAARTTYQPDFAVLLPGGLIELVEVKAASRSKRATQGAWWEDDARVKVKAAAELYGTLFRFVAVHFDRTAGCWLRHEFAPRAGAEVTRG